MGKIRKEYSINPDFDPAKVANASSAAEGLCKWVLALEIYDRVAKVVAPKKERLKQAETELSVTMAELNEKSMSLKAIEEKLANLKASFQEAIEKKEKLVFQVRDPVLFSALLSCPLFLFLAPFSYYSSRLPSCPFLSDLFYEYL